MHPKMIESAVQAVMGRDRGSVDDGSYNDNDNSQPQTRETQLTDWSNSFSQEELDRVRNASNNKEGFDIHQDSGSILSRPATNNDEMNTSSTPIYEDDSHNIPSTPETDYETSDQGFRDSGDVPDSSVLYNDDNQVVLGKFPEYIEKSEELGAKRFEVPSDIWDSFSDNEKWEANKKFLDRAINNDKEIILSTPITQDSYNGFYKKEIDYLSTKGFELNNDGTKLIRTDE